MVGGWLYATTMEISVICAACGLCAFKDEIRFEACDKRANQPDHLFSIHINTIFKFINWNYLISRRRIHAHGPLAEHLMHVAHKMGNTLGVSKPSSDWLISPGFPGDACVAFFNDSPGNKAIIILVIVFITMTMIAHQDQLKAGFLK